jgi:hypothetical protein
MQTLHNFRLCCPTGILFRNSEDCLKKSISRPSIAHKCYHGSRGASAAVTAMLATHRLLGTRRDAVDVYIALCEFSRRKFIEAGLPANKIAVKPNFAYP